MRSFDVFDTVITRTVGDPTTAFLLVGEAALRQRLWSGSSEQFAYARVAAETRARNAVAPHEVTFARIYRELTRSYDLSEETATRLSALELTIERRLLRGVPALVGELTGLRVAGHPIGFISDMYLGHDTLRAWLVDLGVMRESERLWVSSEHGVTKSSGGLFGAVRAELAPGAIDWVHKGDNEHSDVSVPSRMGIRTEHFVDCHLNANEQLLEASSTATRGLASLFAGASRWTRIDRAEGADVALNELAAGVGGPVLFAFVLWTLLEAKKRGLTRIWFMARDGQVMLPIARMLASRLGIEIEAGYLYGGRQVVRVASLTAIDAPALEWMTGGAGVMSLQSVLDRVGLQVSDVKAVAVSMNLPTIGPIGWGQVPLLKRFLEHSEVAALILAEGAARRAVVLDYFKSCGLIGDDRCAIVDIGWRGNVLRSIVDLIGIDQASRHAFMYFGLYGHPRGCDAVPKIAYLFDVDGTEHLGTGRDIPSMTTLMEIFCQADHGQVMGLERQADGFTPVCRGCDDDALESRWDIKQFQADVLKFAETVPIDLVDVAGIDLRGVCERLLRRLASDPTTHEAELLAPIGFVDDQGGSAPHRFAHGYGWQHVRVAYRTGEARPILGLNWWTAAAAMLTPKPVGWWMRAAAKFGRWRSRSASGANVSHRATP